MQPETTQPFYQKLSHTLIALSLITLAIYLGQDIMVPLAMAGLLAVLLRPIEDRLIQWKFPKGVAISVALLLAIVVLAGLAVFFSMQLAQFSDDLPKLKQNINEVYAQVRGWVLREYNVSYKQQDKYMKQAQSQTMDSLQGAGTLSFITGPLGTLILLPIYVFLLLYYRSMLLHFVTILFSQQQAARVREIMGAIKVVIQSYVVGLLLEAASVAALNTLGLVVLGVQYAVLLGVMAAILNLIPYIGGLVAIVLTILITFVNQPEPSTLLGVGVVFLVVQFIDNNVLVPVIIGSKVRINALISIVAVLIGGALAGVSGMFLSIPAVAILKVIFDRVEGLEPWGVLIGDQTPEQAGSDLFGIRRKKISRRQKSLPDTKIDMVAEVDSTPAKA